MLIIINDVLCFIETSIPVTGKKYPDLCLIFYVIDLTNFKTGDVELCQDFQFLQQ